MLHQLDFEFPFLDSHSHPPSSRHDVAAIWEAQVVDGRGSSTARRGCHVSHVLLVGHTHWAGLCNNRTESQATHHNNLLPHRYGKGKWRAIQKDPRFATVLANRSNIDLKDKWRNLNIKGTSPQPHHAPTNPSTKPHTPNQQDPADSGAASSDATAQHMALIDHVLRVVGFFDEADIPTATAAPLLETTDCRPADSNVSASSFKRRDADDAVSSVELYAPTIPNKRPRTHRRAPLVDDARAADDDMLLAGVAVDSAAHGGSATLQGVCAWVEGHYHVSPRFRDCAAATLERLVGQGRLGAVGPGRYALARTMSTPHVELDKAAAVAAAKLTSHVMACVLMQQRWEESNNNSSSRGCAVDELRGVDCAGMPGLAASH